MEKPFKWQIVELTCTGKTKSKKFSQEVVPIIYWNKRELDLALEYYNKSLEIYENIGNQSGISTLLHNIGVIYMLTKEN